MANSPSLSVLLPVFNGGELLDVAVESVLSQSFEDFELLLLDDGSTDGAVERLKANGDPRLHIHRAEKNQGLTRTLNWGLELAHASLVARMDADDVSEPERFAMQIEQFRRQSNLVLLGTAASLVDSAGRLFGRIDPPISDAEVRRTMFRQNPFVHASVMFRRDVIKQLGGYRDGAACAEDYDLFLRAAMRFSCRNLSEPLVRYRVHASQISQTRLLTQSATANAIQQRSWTLAQEEGLTAGCLPPVRQTLVGRFLGEAGTVGAEFQSWSSVYNRMGDFAAAGNAALRGLRFAPLSPLLWAMLVRALVRSALNRGAPINRGSS